MKLLVTGGTGYIGSHTSVELINAGHEITIIDNLKNSKLEVLNRLEQITGKKPEFFQIDLLDKAGLDKLIDNHKFDAVIHFAGLKAVGESVQKPLLYYQNNLTGTLNLLDIMTKYSVKNLVFSSSACVYGQPKSVPITEDFPLAPENPYGWTKMMIEQILKDLHRSDPGWNITLLRYFNPVGAHSSGLIGEDPQGIPNNLTPYITQVAVGKLKQLSVFGGDYPTPDGTCIRDYIHITDLAQGHLKALDRLSKLSVYNLGTGHGISVLQVVTAFEKAICKKIPYQIVGRRPGDAVSVYADATLAKQQLDWEAVKTIDDMCASAWHWQSQNPHGYPD